MTCQITSVLIVQLTSMKTAINSTTGLSLMALELASSAKTVRNRLQIRMAINPTSAQPQIARGKVIRKPRSSMKANYGILKFSLNICWPGAVGTFFDHLWSIKPRNDSALRLD